MPASAGSQPPDIGDFVNTTELRTILEDRRTEYNI